jgi:hypothetical protein
MPKNIRLKTEIGTNKNLQVKIDQDFDYLEILSLKIKQEDVYTRFCADYGVVTGRVVANGGFGVPNANVSVFVPLDQIDESDPVISTLYPYKRPSDKNEDGYRYNLLPYVQENFAHNPTGTFPSRNDILTRKEVLKVYEKYYKYTVKTNSSGDFMIVGVPLGQQKVVLDLDLSNIGQFSLRPADFIRTGQAVATQFSGQFFKASENLDSLPQIVHDVVDVDVASFWGDNESCDVGITRIDFDLRELGIEIQPTAVFMGSFFSSSERDFLKSNCKPKPNTGNLCTLETAPGQILCLRQTIDIDENGDPILEQHSLENNGNLIDEDGTWMVDIPMNLDYLTTNEFGETIISNDPTVGIPSKGKYRFKIKWQSEAGLKKSILRANYLVPNIKEHWQLSATRPNDFTMNKSYSFSLDWDDYYDKEAAIECKDTFYEFKYNKVYTVSSHIDRFKFGRNRARHLGIKEIDDRSCESELNKLPVNDGVRNFDFLFFVFSLLLIITTPMVFVVLPIVHFLAFIWPPLRLIINAIRKFINKIREILCAISDAQFLGIQPFAFIKNNNPGICEQKPLLGDENPFENLALPMLPYPDCETCNCQTDGISPDTDQLEYQEAQIELAEINNVSSLADVNTISTYKPIDCTQGNDNSNYTIGNDEYIQERMMVFAGATMTNDIAPNDNLGLDASFARWYNSPVYPRRRWEYWGGQAGCVIEKKFWITGPNPTYPQVLNLMNQRARYFMPDQTDPFRRNKFLGIRGKLQNVSTGGGGGTGFSGGGGPGGSANEEWWDMPLVVLVDDSNNWVAGDLFSFVDPESSAQEDPNLSYYSGGTVGSDNGFGRKGITANTETNATGIVNKQIKYLNPYYTPDNNEPIERTANIQLFNSATTTDYKFSCGVEYFQCIQSIPISEFAEFFGGSFDEQGNYTEIDGNTSGGAGQTYLSLRQNSLIYQYLFKTDNRVICNLYNTPDPGLDPCLDDAAIFAGQGGQETWNTAANFEVVNGFKDMKLVIMTRGVDPHTPRQNMRYGLGKLYGRNQSFYTPHRIEGNFYMNIPIQHNGGQNTYAIYDHKSPQAIYKWNQAENPVNGYWESNNAGADFLATSNDSSSAGYSCFHKPYTVDFNFEDPNDPNSYGKRFQTTGFTHYVSMGKEIANNLSYRFSTYSNATTGNSIIEEIGNLSPGNLAVRFNGYNTRLLQGADDCGNLLTGVQVRQTENGDGNFEKYEGRVEGCTMQFSKRNSNAGPLTSDQSTWAICSNWGRCIDRSDVGTLSPTYYRQDSSIPHTTLYGITVFRSDRLPTSDSITLGYDGTLQVDQRFALHMNPSFRVYKYNDEGNVTQIEGGGLGTSQADSTGNLDDQLDEMPSQLVNVANSFTCEGMTSLECYTGQGEEFDIVDPCQVNVGENKFFDYGDRTKGGCYRFVRPKFIRTLGLDFRYFFEWRTRFRIMFAMCRGVLSHVFQNNWINGTLYYPSFQKKTIFGIETSTTQQLIQNAGQNSTQTYTFQYNGYVTIQDTNNVQSYTLFLNGEEIGDDIQSFQFNSNYDVYFSIVPINASSISSITMEVTDTNISYRYCGSSSDDGPLYFNTQSNSFFYRSTPTYNNNFVGQTPSESFAGANDKNIWFPTTIMDLGPREQFLKETINSPEYESFIMDKLQSSSYEDTGDIINLFLLSRLTNTTFLQNLFNAGDASVRQLFSRDENGLFNEDRLDADCAQMFSINSEFGVVPYLAGNYADSITVLDDRFGIWFDSDLIDRRELNPGITTFGEDEINSPTNTFGYLSSQIVPYYRWGITPNNGLFGTELNEWNTSEIYSMNYQNSQLESSGYVVPQSGPAYGYIYNATVNDPEYDSFPSSTSQYSVKVGSPYHFYFGLKKGKSSLNKFI